MKIVVIEIELEIDETQDSNGGIASGIEQTLIDNEYGKPNYVICRDKFRHHNTTNPITPRPPTV